MKNITWITNYPSQFIIDMEKQYPSDMPATHSFAFNLEYKRWYNGLESRPVVAIDVYTV